MGLILTRPAAQPEKMLLFHTVPYQVLKQLHIPMDV